ncbi:MAG: methylated-DNA/protein-cysteinemethyltransferase [Ignavibacteria bacterium]|nr:methylated-DNA/protein-cysteinemethyltransferase [Ignavibacteria bacterium]
MDSKSINEDFFNKVYDIVERIPSGKVTTYGAIGKAIGMISSARMVGWALNAVAGDSSLPCHRVVNRVGELSGKMYFSTPHLMKELLISEGITFKGDAVDMKKHFWEPTD